MNKQLPHIISSVVFIWFYLIEEALFFSSVGLGATAFLLVLFINRLGKTIPVIELLLTVAALQWIVGPYLDYRSSAKHYKYFMYVSEETYMHFVVPSLILFACGSLLFLKKYDVGTYFSEIGKKLKESYNLPYWLIGFGFLASTLQNYVPSSLGFVFHLVSQFKYIGLVYLFFRKEEGNRKWIIFCIIFLITFSASVQSGMFHDLFLWSVLLFSFVVYSLGLSFTKRFITIVLGISLAFLVQSVKAEYRAIVWSKEFKGDKIDLFLSLVTSKIYNIEKEKADEEELNTVNARLNQGWIISAILYNVPVSEPYAGGETIQDAVYSSLLPRFLNPDKKDFSDRRENFIRFTGLELGTGVSMGTSVIGEAYANFGSTGAMIFMFFWGFFLCFIVNQVIRLSDTHPSLILWLPLIFLQVVKAETELLVVLNHLVKACVIVYFVFWISRKVFKIQF